MNLDSEDSSGPPPELNGSALLLYDRLHELKTKIYKIRHEDVENLAQKENSLDQGFLGSLPVSMKSLSGSASIKLDQMLTSLEQSIEKNEIQFEFRDDNFTINDKENFIMTLIDKEGTNGQDVRLEDILSDEHSGKKDRLDYSLSFLENSSRIQNSNQFQNSRITNSTKVKNQSDQSLSFFDNSMQTHKESQKNIEKHSLENSKPDLDIRLSPISTPKKPKKIEMIENLSQESSIVMNDNTSSFISENSFLNDERRKYKVQKRSDKNILRRPKISDYEDSSSSIFPPINTSSDDQSFRLAENKMFRRLPLVPCKPICAPPKDRFNVRGRSLLPIQGCIGNSPKVTPIVDNGMNKSASPNTINKLRMRRYKEMTRPFIKISNNKLIPKEPIGLSYNNGIF